MFTQRPRSEADTHRLVIGCSHGCRVVIIEHELEKQRFTLRHEGHQAYVQYHLAGNQMDITGTQVPAAIGGQGIAGQLNKHALEHARNAGLTVVASCSYTQAYVRRHPQYQDLLEQ